MPHWDEGVGTNDYEMRVYVDDYDKVVIAPYFEILREDTEIGRTDASNVSGVERIPGVGWRLSDQSTLEEKVWEHALPSGIELGSSDVDVPSGMLAAMRVRRVDEELPGVSYVAGVAASSRFGWQKIVNAAVDWDHSSLRLGTDETDWPDPVTDSEATDMDRMIRTKELHNPDNGLYYRWEVPTSVWNDITLLQTIHFSGPPSSQNGANGTGQYALAMYGGGYCRLFENLLAADGTLRTTPEWAQRAAFRLDGVQGGSKTSGSISIISNASRACDGVWTGNKIVFFGGYYSGDATPGLSILLDSIALASSARAKESITYNAPQDMNLRTYPTYVRVSVRRDVRSSMTLRRSGYVSPGLLLDDPFSLDHLPYQDPTNERALAVRWYGDHPPGASLSVAVCKAGYADDVDFFLDPKPDLNKQTCTGDYYFFELPPREWRDLQVLFTWTNDTSPEIGRTCTMRRYQVFVAGYKQGAYPTKVQVAPLGQRDAVGAFVANSLLQTSMTAIDSSEPGESLDKESFSFTIDDPGRAADVLFSRVGTPISLALYRRSTDTEITVKRGIIAAPSANVNHAVDTQSSSKVLEFSGSTRIKKFPDYNNKTYNLAAYGEHHRLDRRLLSSRVNMVDPATGRPYNVCKLMRKLLALEGGYDANQIILPNSAMEFFIADQSSASVIEPQTKLKPLLSEWAIRYLGGFWVFDVSAHTYGAWRLLQRKTPPYTPLIRFTTTVPSTNRALTLQPPLYAASTVNGQEVVHIPIFSMDNRVKGNETWERPEANCVVVIGGGVKAPTPTVSKESPLRPKGVKSAGSIDNYIMQMAVNVKSYNALLLDDGHSNFPTPNRGGRDYLGEYVPVFAYQATLGTQAAVDWACRRIYDFIAHARSFRRFRSWMPIITDASDAHQLIPRIPRFYDPVQVYDEEEQEWVDYVICDCKIVGIHDRLMMMDYVIVRTEAFDEFASPIPNFGFYERMMRMVRDSMEVSGNKGATKAYHEIDSRTIKGRGPWTSLPSIPADPIQDLDPESSTFGKFKWMSNYDPVG